ncbi:MULTISPECIES: hypothetical protein [Streptosporangium]|uniref:Uncharacterized protein n=2 Tax=Streptosporangium TaxID=2000 RepID=D2B8Q3_STRRD|nr:MULTISPECIES: hypothetical protein [Streptosporangium]ACZ87863.1 hypothetical protein Sros_5074 [Streptosporangium roseum DSM 43021]OUC97725.1 hypothetical protein CA984_09930 [Streptosporangium minutum]
MRSIVARGVVAAMVTGLAVLAPAAAFAAPAATGQASVLEERGFNGMALENSPKEAKREAENDARRQALISGFSNEQCVLLFADSSRLGPGYYWGSASIRCTR